MESIPFTLIIKPSYVPAKNIPTSIHELPNDSKKYDNSTERTLITRCRNLEGVGVNRHFFKIQHLTLLSAAWTGQTGPPDRSDQSEQADTDQQGDVPFLELESIRNLGYVFRRVFLSI